jgi:hypothetical protein
MSANHAPCENSTLTFSSETSAAGLYQAASSPPISDTPAFPIAMIRALGSILRNCAIVVPTLLWACAGKANSVAITSAYAGRQPSAKRRGVI